MTKKGRTPEEWAAREKMLKEHLAGLVATLDQGLEITRIRQEGPTPEPVADVEIPEEEPEPSVPYVPLDEIEEIEEEIVEEAVDFASEVAALKARLEELTKSAPASDTEEA